MVTFLIIYLVIGVTLAVLLDRFVTIERYIPFSLFVICAWPVLLILLLIGIYIATVIVMCDMED